MLEQIVEQVGYAIVAIGVILIIATIWMISKTGNKRKGKKIKD